jgi:hypothetical protein
MLGKHVSRMLLPLGPNPLRAKVALFLVTALTATLDARAALNACPVIFPASLMVCHRLEGSTWMAWSETRWGS